MRWRTAPAARSCSGWHGAATTGQLAALLPKISRPAVSQHLKVLREAGLIR